jgi:hypothetical protein
VSMSLDAQGAEHEEYVLEFPSRTSLVNLSGGIHAPRCRKPKTRDGLADRILDEPALRECSPSPKVAIMRSCGSPMLVRSGRRRRSACVGRISPTLATAACSSPSSAKANKIRMVRVSSATAKTLCELRGRRAGERLRLRPGVVLQATGTPSVLAFKVPSQSSLAARMTTTESA